MHTQWTAKMPLATRFLIPSFDNNLFVDRIGDRESHPSQEIAMTIALHIFFAIQTLIYGKPTFEVGQVVRLKGRDKYVVIRHIRHIRPNGERRSRWVYDGIAFSIDNGELRYSTSATALSERNIDCVIGF